MRAPGFAELSEEDRQAIFHFSVLWSFFEARALSTNGSAGKILSVTHEWAALGHLTLQPFENSLDYFRARYVANGAPTQLFQGLAFREYDKPALVLSVLKGEDMSLANTVAALLLVAFRLRNNLFHGTKWAYGIQGQRENFNQAAAVLMAALDAREQL